MKRVLLLSLVAVIVVAANSAWSNESGLENGSWTSVDEQAAKERAGYAALQEECEAAVKKARTAIQTYIETVVTVAKALLKAILIVLVSIVKLIARFAFAVVLIVARWLLSLFLPV